MYTEENWDTFFDIYIKSRCEIFSEITSYTSILNLISAQPFCKIPENMNVPSILDNLTPIGSYSNEARLVLLSFLQKLEVHKKIYTAYSPERSTEEISIEYYTKLAFCFARFLNLYDLDLRVMNILLKLNDKLLYRKQEWIGTRHEGFVLYAIQEEINFVKKIRENSL